MLKERKIITEIEDIHFKIPDLINIGIYSKKFLKILFPFFEAQRLAYPVERRMHENCPFVS